MAAWRICSWQRSRKRSALAGHARAGEEARRWVGGSRSGAAAWPASWERLAQGLRRRRGRCPDCAQDLVRSGEGICEPPRGMIQSRPRPLAVRLGREATASLPGGADGTTRAGHGQ